MLIFTTKIRQNVKPLQTKTILFFYSGIGEIYSLSKYCFTSLRFISFFLERSQMILIFSTTSGEKKRSPLWLRYGFNIPSRSSQNRIVHTFTPTKSATSVIDIFSISSFIFSTIKLWLKGRPPRNVSNIR